MPGAGLRCHSGQSLVSGRRVSPSASGRLRPAGDRAEVLWASVDVQAAGRTAIGSPVELGTPMVTGSRRAAGQLPAGPGLMRLGGHSRCPGPVGTWGSISQGRGRRRRVSGAGAVRHKLTKHRGRELPRQPAGHLYANKFSVHRAMQESPYTGPSRLSSDSSALVPPECAKASTGAAACPSVLREGRGGCAERCLSGHQH